MNNLNKVSLIGRLYQKSGINPFESFYKDMDGNTISCSQKLLLEGIDFDLVYTPLKHLGYKAVLSVLGPLYASGFDPFQLSLTIGLSARFSQEEIESLWEGMDAAFKEHKIDSIKLDLLPSLTGLTISLSSLGKQSNQLFVQRPQCKEGDLLCVSGSLGAAYLGLQILEREKRVFDKANAQPKLDGYKFVLQQYLSPHIDRSLFDLLKATSILPSTGEFLTEGLAHSVKNICANHSVGAKIFMNRLPIPSPASDVANELNLDPLTAALNGGDDYKFLFAIPLDKHQEIQKELPQLDIIGHLSSLESGLMLITPDGQELELKAQAWDK